jgi:hypothetical protein
MRNRKNVFALAVLSLSLSAFASCPTLSQTTITYSDGSTKPAIGLANGATLTVYVVGTLSSAHSAISAAATANVSLTGSTITVTTTDVTGPPSSNTGTASAPALIVQIVSNAQMNAFGGSCPTSPACTFITQADTSGHTMTAMTFINSDTAAWTHPEFGQLEAHEDGHALLGLNDCSDCANTEMNPLATTASPSGPTDCDSQQVFTATGGAYGTDPNPPPPPPSCGPGPCCVNYDYVNCICLDDLVVDGCTGKDSPILLSFERGVRYPLVGLHDGVRFDIRADGTMPQMAWTQAGTAVGFLALDRNQNGTIDDGTELFGNHTPEGEQVAANGFEALAYYDLPRHGGNGDGWIDANDGIFSQLLVWIDLNHDGISQPDELFRLSALGVSRISLQYKDEMRKDRYGNIFHLKSEFILDGQHRACYDVYFATQTGQGNTSSRLRSNGSDFSIYLLEKRQLWSGSRSK